MPERVAVVTAKEAEDPCIDLVRQALARRGAELVVLDASRFPSQRALHFTVGDDRARAEFGGVDLTTVRSVWLRHLWGEVSLPRGMARAERAAAESQARAALLSLFECLDVFQLDPPDVLQGLGHKPRTMRLAAELGLEVPRSIITNDPAAVRDFAARVPGELVCKLIDSGAVAVRQDGEVRSFPTFALGRDELDDLDGLAVGPMIVQERIDKVLEARITVVGREMFVAAVDPKGAVDARLDPELIRGLRRYDDLPEAVRARIFALLDRLRLNFATVDLLRAADGRWVFLEANSVSFFDHVEVHAGLPVSAAVADLLLGRALPRV